MGSSGNGTVVVRCRTAGKLRDVLVGAIASKIYR